MTHAQICKCLLNDNFTRQNISRWVKNLTNEYRLYIICWTAGSYISDASDAGGLDVELCRGRWIVKHLCKFDDLNKISIEMLNNVLDIVR